MKLKISALVALALASSASLGAAEKMSTSTINVYSASPLPSIGLPLNVVPANIQIVKSKDLNNQAGVSIADYMNNNMQGVSIAEMGGNPYQLEVNFRGYSASPLLGNAQGISVYVDGVRANEPFGDITSWDKIPNFAIKSMQMVPGSNPIYGLNTLGGAMAIQTKSGREAKGLGVEFEAGSWGRQRSLAEFGGVSKDGSTIVYGLYTSATCYLAKWNGSNYSVVLSTLSLPTGSQLTLTKLTPDGNTVFIATNGGSIYYSVISNNTFGTIVRPKFRPKPNSQILQEPKPEPIFQL